VRLWVQARIAGDTCVDVQAEALLAATPNKIVLSAAEGSKRARSVASYAALYVCILRLYGYHARHVLACVQGARRHTTKLTACIRDCHSTTTSRAE
jgi:hypothetical protein